MNRALIAGLSLVLFVLTSTAATSVKGDLYWAVVTDVFLLPDDPSGAAPQYYGAAWNFASREEAEEAAFQTCGRQSHRGGCNTLASSGKNSCFFVLKWNITYKNYSGTHTTFGVSRSEGYPSKAAVEAAAKRIAADNSYTNEFGTTYKGSIDLVECAGVE